MRNLNITNQGPMKSNTTFPIIGCVIFVLARTAYEENEVLEIGGEVRKLSYSFFQKVEKVMFKKKTH